MSEPVYHAELVQAVELVHPSGGRILLHLPMDVDRFARLLAWLAADGWELAR